MGHRASILVVDDRPEKLLAAEAILSDMDLEIVAVDSGRKALRQVLRREFALILLDVDMPTMDGFETAALIRQRQLSEHIPIIFITAHGDARFTERGYSLGAVDYILQPVVPEVLRAKVTVFVELFRQRRQMNEQAEWHRRRAEQLQRFAQASVRIQAAATIDDIVARVADAACELVSARHVLTVAMLPGRSPSTAAARCPEQSIPFNEACEQHCRAVRDALNGRASVLLDSGGLGAALWPDFPGDAAVLAAPLGRPQDPLGFIAALGAAFTPDDEMILVLLARLTTIAIENALGSEARDANRAKDQFLAVLSHELRTPLTPALAMLSMLTGDVRLPDDVRSDLRMVQHNVELEARLIDDLLDLTRISRGKVELRLSRVDVHSALDEALKVCQVDLSRAALRLCCDYRAEHSFVRADAVRLQQIFWNLINNAIKFTPAGGTITLESANAPDESLLIRIADTGIGIDPQVLPRIFNAFEQGGRTISRQFGGLGLGLAITKALLERHQGTISAASEGLGKGSAFMLHLPTDREEHPTSKIVQPHLVGAPPQRRLRVLLVEDHADTAHVIKRLLVRQSHEVTTARSMAEALAAATAAKFDLVISDIGLPDGSGLELMPQLRARGLSLGIALSGFGMDEDVTRSRAAGFREHLTKPMNFQTLADCIERLCAEMDELDQSSPWQADQRQRPVRLRWQ